MKKIVSLLLAAAIAIGMTATVFAANPKITKQATALADVYEGDVKPGTQIFLPLVKEAFEGATEDLTASDVRTSKITVKHTAKSGPKAIESVEIKENSAKKAGVLITLVDTFVSTKPLDFEVTVTLYIDGKRQSDSTYVSGTLTNDEQDVYSDTDYLDLSDGSVAVCAESATKVETFLGEGVTMFVRMVKGKSYAGVAKTEPTESDIDILDQYPDIVEVYNLTLTGLTGTGKIVQIDSAAPHVYDGDLNYLGTTDGLLPLSTKYFIAANKLDVIAAGEDEPEDSEDEYYDETEDDYDPADVDESDTMPAVSPSTSKSDNPSTGIPALFGISMAAGMLSLAAMGIVGLKNGKKR